MKQKQTYLFYDIETSGLNIAFDQILQFAAIRTDLELNELERHDITVRLSPDVIPSPEAVLIHQISPLALKHGMSEVEAVCKIHALLNTPGTISLGYNTLKFDDKFLRFSFYRHLLPPYTHQYAHQCRRLDIYPITALYFLYHPALLKWPVASLKLSDISELNQLTTGRAHHAMTDVAATVALAQQLKKETKTWHYLQGYFDKNIFAERCMHLQEGLLIAANIGIANFYQTPVLALGTHNHYKNQTLWLRLDDEKLSQTTGDTVSEHTRVYALKSGEANFILPLTDKYTRHLSQERWQRAAQNKQWLLNHPDLLSQIMHYYKSYKYPYIPNVDIDASLYQIGFLSEIEQQRCAAFHQAEWAHKASYIQKFSPRLREQAIRLMGRNYPEYLTEAYMPEFEEYLRQISPASEEDALIDYRGRKKLTPKAALLEINNLKHQAALNEKQINLLNDLECYIQVKFLSRTSS